MIFTTRFAPSPTGPLHLGHAYSALLGYDMALAEGGTFHLRIDDLDQSRCRPAWEAQIADDLAWLGLNWPRPVRRESEHHTAYDSALDRLWNMGLLYPCTCSRRDIREAASAPQEGAPLTGPDGIIYPGTCPHMGFNMWPRDEPRPKNTTLRLDTEALTNPRFDKVFELDEFIPTETVQDTYISFEETGEGPEGESGLIKFTLQDLVTQVGDVVIARNNGDAAYHLAVVIDDAAQGITDVVRGEDLFTATYIHVVLQRLLGLPTPRYHHHRLIRDDAGKRLAKRDDARAIATYRAEGKTPADIRAMVGL